MFQLRFPTLHILFVLALGAITATCTYTNLPDVPPGVFEVSTRIEIFSTKRAAWDALTNFRDYADWNPFVRSAVVVSPLNVTLPRQYPVEGKRLFMRTQIPPLPLPVNRNTPDNLLNTQLAYENITHVQPRLGRLAWEYAGEFVLQAERWQAVSDIRRGVVLYESREVFHGLMAPELEVALGDSLQKAFDAQGQGLKLLLERGAST
ncbi:hypothetical protein BKA66DRAFT_436125 [Pyrenochaeta sp. MPI-SDFR-AT-0127]|nr:hypothetical protein BKA66DRAFT_436125 [Pyrenochaeta sp. MPI-SDFR-AT-0127]